MPKKISIMVIDWPKISHSGLSEPRTTSMGAYRAESGRDSRLRSSRPQHVMRKMTEDPFVVFCGEDGGRDAAMTYGHPGAGQGQRRASPGRAHSPVRMGRRIHHCGESTDETDKTCRTLLLSVSQGYGTGEYTNFDLLVARASTEDRVAISGEPTSAQRARFDHGASLSINQPPFAFRA